MTDEQFSELAEMLQVIYAELQNVVTENQTTAAQLADIFSEIQRGLAELGY